MELLFLSTIGNLLSYSHYHLLCQFLFLLSRNDGKRNICGVIRYSLQTRHHIGKDHSQIGRAHV